MREKAYDLKQKEREQLKDLLTEILKAREDVLFAYVYGSFFEGLPFHDVDVGVYLAGITEQESTRSALSLAQTLSTGLRMPVDVRILNFAPVSFLYQVVQGDLIFERNEEVRSRLVERTVQRYLDIKPILYRGIKEAFAG